MRSDRSFCSSMKAAVGLTCLSSPTINTFFARRIAVSAEISDCDASSNMTRSKELSVAGRLSEILQVGMIQHGTAA